MQWYPERLSNHGTVIISTQQVLLQADRAMRNHRAQSRTVLSVGLV